MKRFTRMLVPAAMAGLVTVAQAAPPPEQAAPPSEDVIRQVYARLLTLADTDKDGKLSFAECTSIFTNPASAKRNCRFFDVDKDGFITPDEYVAQVIKKTSGKH